MAITAACVAAGFDGMAKEVFDEKGNLQQEANLLRLEVIAEVEAEITGGKVFGTWLAPPCKTWGFFGALNGCSRTAEMPEGNNETDYELEGTLNMGVALYLFVDHFARPALHQKRLELCAGAVVVHHGQGELARGRVQDDRGVRIRRRSHWAVVAFLDSAARVVWPKDGHTTWMMGESRARRTVR